MNILAAIEQYSIDWTPIILAIIGIATTYVSLLTKKSADKAASQATQAYVTSNETKIEVNSRMTAFIKDLDEKNAVILRHAIAKAREEGLKQAQEAQVFQAKMLAEAAATAAATAITGKPIEVKVVNKSDEKVPVIDEKLENAIEVKVANEPTEPVPITETNP